MKYVLVCMTYVDLYIYLHLPAVEDTEVSGSSSFSLSLSNVRRRPVGNFRYILYMPSTAFLRTYL